MTFSIVHLSDPHFGVDGDLQKIHAVEDLVADLEPDTVVVSGDLTERARHGEFLAARLWIRHMERASAVFAVPGDHDVQWWRRPLLPFGAAAKYRNFARYFGPILSPTLNTDEAVIAGLLTAHGLAWRSLTPRFRDLALTGHVPPAEVARVRAVFAGTDEAVARVVVMHHNILRGERSGRMGVTGWQTAHKMVQETRADLVLCGHDHQDKADVMGGIVVSCAGTLSARHAPDHPVTFHRILIEADAIHIEVYRWEHDIGRFRRTDEHAFARARVARDAAVATGTV